MKLQTGIKAGDDGQNAQSNRVTANHNQTLVRSTR
jgi:hypothetical protein